MTHESRLREDDVDLDGEGITLSIVGLSGLLLCVVVLLLR